MPFFIATNTLLTPACFFMHQTLGQTTLLFAAFYGKQSRRLLAAFILFAIFVKNQKPDERTH
ncbi:MAG: hypothetical protein BGO48_05060 [Mucilaginibacter sp. 44-25]|nr:MAG: hypothetical protein BGO48_05060 [Mucilaginibacter sp. 44-25]